MAVLIDPPRWPAHGTVFSHLVSDESLNELHAFAAAAGVPYRAFDHDHYDVPEARHPGLVAAGAEPVSENELVRRLIASGLRVRTPQRLPKRAEVLPLLGRRWEALLPQAPELGADLVRRWSEPKRHYHDVRHLAHCLAALDVLRPESKPTLRLALWFHDAIYLGRPGQDEEESASLAEGLLPATGLPAVDVAEVARLVRLTRHHAPEEGDDAGAAVVDADLSILGSIPGRYHVYVRDVRWDYDHVPEDRFVAGRLLVIDDLLGRDPLFHTDQGRARWERQARINLLEERDRWLRADQPRRHPRG